jgi:hypothetical protein
MISQKEGYRAINPGVILVEKSTLLPYPLRLESDATGSGWARAANNLDSHQLEQKLASAGWTFFYIAGAIRTIGFGFERQGMIQAAMKRLIAAVRLQGCNCLVIDGVAPRSLLGMPYVRISAHARQIQNGGVFGRDGHNGRVIAE